MKEKICREYRIGAFFADGCIPEEKVIFEFFDCFYHGCPKCYMDRNEQIVLGSLRETTPGKLYEDVQRKLKCYENLGYTIVKT